MADFNLETEYGLYLDLLDEALHEMNTVQHFGVKGMKWGVRKERTPAEQRKHNPIVGLGPESVSRKTRSGETLTLQKKPAGAFAQFLGRHSEGYRKLANNDAYLTIHDSSGKKVGDCELTKVNKDEINLVWLGINRGERGKGYASAVMQAGVEFGKQSGAKRLTLEVPGNSPDAAHIYQKLGFKFVNNQSSYHNDPKEGVWGGLYNMELNFDEGVKHMSTNGTSPAMQRYYERKKALIHYGKKGMKWGVRNDKPATAVTIKTRPGKLVKAKGGKRQAASEDAVTAVKLHQTAKKSTTDALSNKELQALVQRMQLEQQFSQLSASSPRMPVGQKIARDFLSNGGRDITISGIKSATNAATIAVPGGKAAKVGVQLGGAIATAVVNKNTVKKK